MADHHVTTDAGSASAGGGLCGCGCGRALPAGPSGGGRVPVYASRGCQQRAYRARQAARATPADPVSVAGLLAGVRALAGVLDAGGRPDAAVVEAVRVGAEALLARATPEPSPAPTAAAALAGAGPSRPPRSSRDDRGRTPAGTGRPVVIRGERGEQPLSPETSAAVRAVAAADPGTALTLTRPGDGDGVGAEWEVTAGGVRLGWARRVYGARGSGRGWQAVSLDATRGRAVHRTRQAAAAELAADLAHLAEHARPATLHQPPTA